MTMNYFHIARTCPICGAVYIPSPVATSATYDPNLCGKCNQETARRMTQPTDAEVAEQDARRARYFDGR